MTKTFTNLLLWIAVSMLAVSCDKNDSDQPEIDHPSNNEKIVYVAGYRNVAGVRTAMLWKNGTPIFLTNGTHNSEAHSIYVDGDDVYVAGYAVFGLTQVAVVWKNGTILPLSHDSSEAYAVFVHSGTVYAAGIVDRKAAYWAGIENQTHIRLSNNNGSCAYGIFANDQNVFIAGTTGGNQPAVWKKEGQAISITTEGADKISSVFVVGSDVYAGGGSTKNKKFVATYWKNNQPYQLTDGTRTQHVYNESVVNSMYVRGNDTYAAGSLIIKPAKEIATVWKNNDGEIQLTASSDEPAVAHSIFVSNNNTLYVSGYHRFNKTNRVATLWVDGEPTYLTDPDTNSEAYAVFVKE